MEIPLSLRPPLRLLLGLWCLGVPVHAIDIVQSPQDLKQLDLEELLETKVVSVSRTMEDWTTAPAAIGVLTAEEIHHIGAVRLAEVLRFAPGLNVGRYVGSNYAIGARGFNNSSGNKMQVLLDGRVLYTPLFSGVFWEVQDTLLDDLERIEVVRGPGAALWGANAVNGVINIVSKNAKDTQGTLINAGAGTSERALGSVRYGGKFDDSTYYRAYYKYLDRGDQERADGSSAHDGMTQHQGGFRIDSTRSGGNVLTLQGDLYFNSYGISDQTPSRNDGVNLLGRWTHTFADDANLQTQFYYDRGHRNVPLQFSEDRQTYDLDIQHHRKIGERQNVVMGVDYRHSMDLTGRRGTFIFVPSRKTLQLFSGFLQDEIALDPPRLKLSLGSKFEHNDYSGFEFQPSARLSYMPAAKQTLWLGISRAVRAPTRADTELRFMPDLTTNAVVLYGAADFHSETLVAYELGYRVQPSRRVYLDLATFYNVYDHLRTLEPTPPSGLPYVFGNQRQGDTYGAELNATFQPFSWWQLIANYSYLQKNLRFLPASRDPTGGSSEGNDPRHHGSLRSSMTLRHGVEIDAAVRFATTLPNPRSPGFVAFDLRLAFQPLNHLEVSVVVQNLLDASHPEFAGGAVNQPHVPRSIYGQLTWHF